MSWFVGLSLAISVDGILSGRFLSEVPGSNVGVVYNAPNPLRVPDFWQSETLLQVL